MSPVSIYFIYINQTNNINSATINYISVQIFTGLGDQENAIVKLLCEWAVSPERTGEHRALAVAALLGWFLSLFFGQFILTLIRTDRRQSDTNPSESQETTTGDDKDSNSSLPGGPPMFQSLLMKFLDVDAPIPGPDDSPQVLAFLKATTLMLTI